jgi:nucleotide-binding universal stress UspA family protein
MRLSILTIAQDAARRLAGDRPNIFGPPDPAKYVEQLAERWAGLAPAVVGQVGFDPIGVASGLKAHLASHPTGLVAVATHARSGLDRLRFGATAAEIVGASTAPALVVRVSDP